MFEVGVTRPLERDQLDQSDAAAAARHPLRVRLGNVARDSEQSGQRAGQDYLPPRSSHRPGRRGAGLVGHPQQVDCGTLTFRVQSNRLSNKVRRPVPPRREVSTRAEVQVEAVDLYPTEAF